MPNLKHVPTGDLYPYNSDMAMRDDMVEYIPEPEPKPEPAPKTQPRPKARAKAKPASEPEQDELDFDFDSLPTLGDDE